MNEKKLKYLLIILIIIVIIQTIGGYFGYQHFSNNTDQLEDDIEQLQMEYNQSLEKSDSLQKVFQAVQDANQLLEDTINILNTSLTTLQTKHEKNRNFIRYSSDDEYQDYITTHQLPPFNNRSSE